MKTLRAKINFHFLVLSAITILVLAIFSVVILQKLMLQRGLENAQFLARSIALMVDANFSNTDRLDRFLADIAEFWHLSQVTVRDGDEILYSFPKVQNDLKSGKSARVKFLEASYYFDLTRFVEVKTPLALGGRSAEIVVKLSIVNLQEAIGSLILDYAIISFVVFSLVYFITNFISRLIVGPIRATAMAARGVAAGDYREIKGIEAENELGELITAFNTMVGNLKKSMEENKLAMVGKMSASIAHEIRNPLVTMQGLTEVMLEEAVVPEFKKDLRVIQKEVQRLNLFVEQLLQFARPKPLEFKKENLQKLTGEVLTMMKHDFKQKKIEVVQEWENIPEPLVDANSIKQVFLNLLYNALHFSNQNTVISIKGYFGNLERGHLKVEISDKGAGIPAETLPRVFEPFFTTREGGSGLGLAIVRRIMQAHGGDIYLLSREGVGTTAVLFFPLTDA